MTVQKTLKQNLKLILIVSALCVPLLVFAGLFITQSLKDITFTKHEQLGAAYLRPVWSTLSALYTQAPDTGLPALDDAAAQYNPTLKLQKDYAFLRRSLNGQTDAVVRTRSFLTRISDTSNLTLDPDIDTYYLMNTTVNVLPDIGRHENAVFKGIQTAIGAPASEQAKADLNTAITLLGLATNSAATSLGTAMRGNSGGKVSSAVMPALIDFNRAETAYITEAQGLAARVTAGERLKSSEMARLRPLHSALASATDALWQVSLNDLDRLLAVRIGHDESKLWLLLGLAALISVGAVGVIVYLDLYVQHAQILKLNKTLQAQNDELDRFAYICSHDLQEPVRMMNVYAGMLSAANAGDLNDDAARYVRFIRENATRMQKMISDILTFSRVGREAIRDDSVDCAVVAQAVLGELASVISEKSARVTCGPLPVIKTNSTLILVLFQNLIGNALKFQDGHRPPEISISAMREGANWRFEVRDNGIGIDPAFQDRIFILFQRLNRKEDYPGTGIGLSTCRKFIRLCGGEIGFTSQPGEDTVFFFTLPAKA